VQQCARAPAPCLISYLIGLRAAALCPAPAPPHSACARAGAARRYTSEEIKGLQLLAEACGRTPQALTHTSFNGWSPLLTWLDYHTLDTLMVVPFYHAFLQGVLKDFLRAIFAPATPAGLTRRRDGAPVLPPGKVVTARMRKLVSRRCLAGFPNNLHPQKNRPMPDFVASAKSLTFEDLNSGVTGLLGPAFWPVHLSGGRREHPLHDPHIRQAWGCLRRFACFHLLPPSFNNREEYEAAARAADQEMLSYGRLAQQVGGRTWR
jgi:hypothetical protein